MKSELKSSQAGSERKMKADHNENKVDPSSLKADDVKLSESIQQKLEDIKVKEASSQVSEALKLKDSQLADRLSAILSQKNILSQLSKKVGGLTSQSIQSALLSEIPADLINQGCNESTIMNLVSIIK